MQKLIAFRADASIETGTGHVMRCAALAAALRERGAEILFVCRQLTEGLHDKLSDAGFAVRMLVGGGMFDAETDAEQSGAVLEEFGRPDWLIVDHYGLGASWERQLRPHAERIMVIDDLADRPHDCDLLLDQNHYSDAEDRYRSLVPAACRLLLGPRYAQLRPQFAETRGSRRRSDGVVRRVLICFGGADADNLTARALDAFLAARLSGVVADVVIGGANPHSTELASRYGSLPGIRLHHNVSDMASLMAQADLFLGAGGSMTWERSALGLPGLTIAVAPNQARLCEDLEAMGGGVHLGDPAGANAANIEESLRILAAHPRLLQSFGERLAALTDGRGAARLARLLTAPRISLRPAAKDDSDRLHAWRNAPETRRHSGDGEPIPLEVHRAWFASTLNNPSRILLVGEQSSSSGGLGPVGVVRYDIDGASATISVYLVPGQSGAGLGSALIEAGDAWLNQHHPEIARVHARIDPDNLASVGAFRAAGYVAEASLFMKSFCNRSSEV